MVSHRRIARGLIDALGGAPLVAVLPQAFVSITANRAPSTSGPRASQPWPGHPIPISPSSRPRSGPDGPAAGRNLARAPRGSPGGSQPVIRAQGATVTGGLVTASVKPLFRKRRNWYCPGVVAIVTVQVLVVTPAPT